MILWRVKIPLRRKLILLAIFSLTVIVMVVAIVRVTVVYSAHTKKSSLEWLFFWSSVEVATAIIVACLGSFRQLYVTSQNTDYCSSFVGDKLHDSLHARPNS